VYDKLREPIEVVVRYVAPQLAALIFLLLGLQLLPGLPKSDFAFAAKFIGLLFPALWLTGIGPQGLLREGELLMRLLHVKGTRVSVSLCGLAWLLIYFVCGHFLDVLEIGGAGHHFAVYALYGIGHAGFMSALGIFMFLAVAREQDDQEQ
jgi:hypothetical protein